MKRNISGRILWIKYICIIQIGTVDTRNHEKANFKKKFLLKDISNYRMDHTVKKIHKILTSYLFYFKFTSKLKLNVIEVKLNKKSNLLKISRIFAEFKFISEFIVHVLVLPCFFLVHFFWYNQIFISITKRIVEPTTNFVEPIKQHFVSRIFLSVKKFKKFNFDMCGYAFKIFLISRLDAL